MLDPQSVPKTAGRSHSTWRQIRRQAYQRDLERNAPCWICGKPINYAAKPGSPDAWEPDHRLNVSDHPEFAHDITNVMPSHAHCNRQRGARDRAQKRWRQELGEPSEDWGL